MNNELMKDLIDVFDKHNKNVVDIDYLSGLERYSFRVKDKKVENETPN